VGKEYCLSDGEDAVVVREDRFNLGGLLTTVLVPERELKNAGRIDYRLWPTKEGGF